MFLDGYTAADVVYGWEDIPDSVLIADEAHQTLENKGWKIVGFVRQNLNITLSSGMLKKRDTFFLKKTSMTMIYKC
jgi:hypothetical protein